MRSKKLPIRHENSILEATSERFFRNCIPVEWLVEKPIDYGIDLNITPVVNGNVFGLNFSVQLKAKNDAKNKLSIRLKKTTLNYMFNRLEPIMVVLFDAKSNNAYWKWIIQSDFDLSENVSSYSIAFKSEQNINRINWEEICNYIQKIFKVKNMLLTSLEYDLFNTYSDIEVKAWSHYFSKNYAEASFFFKRLVKLEDKSIWLLALAQCQYQAYDYKNAILTINKALQIDTSENILITKGCILAEEGIKSKDIYKLKEAEKIFTAIYQDNKNSVNAFNLANTTAELGAFEKQHLGSFDQLRKSERLYKRALKLNPSYAEAWKNLGQVYFEVGKHELEIHCYDNALLINPDLTQAKVSRAITLGHIYGKYKLAISCLNASIETDENIFIEFPYIFYWISHFLLRLNKPVESLKWINDGLNNDPGDRWLLNLKANVLFDLLDTDAKFIEDAINFFYKNFELNKNDIINSYYLFTALFKNNEISQARVLALNWLNTRPFVKFSFIDELEFETLIVIVKHWKIVQSYISQYPIEKVQLHFDQEDLINYLPFLVDFEQRRIIFISKISDLIEVNKEYDNFIKDLKDLYTCCFLIDNNTSIKELVTVPKDNHTDFADKSSLVIATISKLCVLEYTRATGFTLGQVTYEKGIPTLNSVIDDNLLLDTIIHYTKIIYLAFELPID